MAQELKAAELTGLPIIVVIIVIAVYRVITHCHESAHSVHFSDIMNVHVRFKLLTNRYSLSIFIVNYVTSNRNLL